MFSRCFTALRSALRQRWLWSLLLVLLGILLLWLVGPLVAVAGYVPLQSVTARLAASLLLLLLWAACTAFGLYRQRKKDEAEPEKAALREKEKEQKRRLRAALAHVRHQVKTALKTATRSSVYGSRSRYALPWYVLIGAPHCGKTSLLLRSGLHFPLNEQKDLQRFASSATEQCEVLYENEALFFDTPGAWTKSDSGETAHRLWKELLRRLFRARPARALNGALVCVSMRDILDADAAKREQSAKTLRARLDEVQKSLRARVPVYLVFTKCDAVPGFTDFFARLSRSEREQIFGRLATGESMTMEELRKALRDMTESLSLRIPSKMHQERDAKTRGGIFRFPMEFAALGPRLEDFLAETFAPSRYYKELMFRGFFLTSALDAGNAAGGKNDNASSAFFLHRLFRDCVIPEARLAGADKEHIWSLRFRRYGAQIAAAGIFLLAVALLGNSFVNNSSRLEDLERLNLSLLEARKAAEKRLDAAALLPELRQAEQSLAVYSPQEDSFFLYGLGLYPGDAHAKAAKEAYLGQLNTRLLPVLRFLAAGDVRRSLDKPAELKSALRAYLMLHDPGRCSVEFMAPRLNEYWRALYAGQNEVQEQLRRHSAHLMQEGMIPATPDLALVQAARDSLLRLPLAERAHQRMREEAEESGYAAFTFRSAIGNSPFEGDEYPIPYLYTREGYEYWLIRRCPDILQDMTGESWIFGEGRKSLNSQNNVDKALKEVRVLYFQEYIRHWREAVQGLRIRTPKNLREASLLADQFAGGVSPPVMVLRELRDNTSFLWEDPAAGADAPEAGATAGQAGKTAGKLVGGRAGKAIALGAAELQKNQQAKAVQAASDTRRDAEAIRRYFTPLDALLDGAGNPGTLLKDAEEAMVKVGDYYSGFLKGDSVESRILTALLEIAEDKNDTLRNLAGAAEDLPQPVRSWYASLGTDGLQRMLALGASAINNAYRERILSIYDARLSRAYPFDPASEQDVRLDEFAEFFRDGGTLESFHESYLQPFIDRSGKLRSIMGHYLPISADAVARMQRAMRVQDAFFLSGRELGINFLMEPLAMDAGLRQVTISNAGRQFSYSHEPAQGAAFSWPPAEGQSARSSLETMDLAGLRVTQVRADGDWALFRLLRGATINGREGNRCRLSLYPGGKQLELLIQFRSKVNPFDPSVCSFALPRSLQ